MDAKTAQDIGVEAYTYLYPLLLMDATCAQATNVEHAGVAVGRGPEGTFVHARAFPPGDYRDVVRPNFDTLYSSAWLQLADEPQIVSVPDAEDRYWLLPMYDMFGEVFACPGTRTTGNGAQAFALVGPGWSGELPGGIRRIDSPHSLVWIIERTEASVATYADIHAFQDGMGITPLSRWPQSPDTVVGRVDPTVDDVTPPLRQVFALDAGEFFGRAAELLRRYPPHFNDVSILLRMEQIGFVTGEPFDLTAAPAVIRDALVNAVPAAQARVTARQRDLGVVRNGWHLVVQNMGSYGQDYLQRACVELIGLGANLPEDAVYPVAFVDGDGEPLNGANSYVLHLAADELPPVRAFWSVTLYDDEGFQVANALDRFAIGDRDDLTVNNDGSLDLYVQHESPPAERAGNWLPAPAGSFNLCLRAYFPTSEVLDGAWVPPAVQRVAPAPAPRSAASELAAQA